MARPQIKTSNSLLFHDDHHTHLTASPLTAHPSQSAASVSPGSKIPAFNADASEYYGGKEVHSRGRTYSSVGSHSHLDSFLLLRFRRDLRRVVDGGGRRCIHSTPWRIHSAFARFLLFEVREGKRKGEELERDNELLLLPPRTISFLPISSTSR